MTRGHWKELYSGFYDNLYKGGDKVDPTQTRSEARRQLVNHLSGYVVPEFFQRVKDGVKRIANDVIKDK